MIPITSLSVYREHYRPGDPKNPSIIKPHKYVSLRLSWIFSRDTSDLCGNVSYRGISAENTMHDPADYTIIHKAEIKDNRVYLNDQLIAIAPENKNKALKEKFCKSIVWSLINDPISLQDKLAEISGEMAMPEIPETIPEKPQYPVGWIPYLRLSITEEVIA
jgi:hypothetical protein